MNEILILTLTYCDNYQARLAIRNAQSLIPSKRIFIFCLSTVPYHWPDVLIICHSVPLAQYDILY